MLGTGLSGLLVFVLSVVVGLLTGAAFGASRARRIASGAFAAIGLALPFLAVPTEGAWRSLAALGAAIGLMRFIEALRTRVELPIPRAFAFILLVDLAQLRRAPPRLATDALARAAVHGAVMAAGLVVISQRALAGAGAPVAAWAGGVLALYGAVDVAASILRTFLAAIGLASAPMQRDPVLSTSVSEFWGERWNRAVGAWLRRHCFLPVARRAGPAAGIVAAFAWSGFLHSWAILAGLGLWPALAMGAFFAVQGLVVLGETRLSVRSWPRPLARLWTFALVLGPSPLFVVPVMQTFGVR